MERPLLFNEHLIPGLLDGSITQTRRPARGSVGAFWDHAGYRPDVIHGRVVGWRYDTPKGTFGGGKGCGLAVSGCPMPLCPHGLPGDLLYVRERHYRWTGCGSPPSDFIGDRCYVDHDLATRAKTAANATSCLATVPSLHMPRWASRITLEITEVRLERIQAISEADALASGVRSTHLPFAGAHGATMYHTETWPTPNASDSAIEAYQALWWKAYGRESWERNQWVWALTFKRVVSNAVNPQSLVWSA